MLNILKDQSNNYVNIVGVLKEINIDKKTTSDGREYVTGKAVIRVDHEIAGKRIESEIPVQMYSMKKKKDGGENSNYASIVKMGEDFISLDAAETPSQASRVAIRGGQISENMWKNSKGTITSIPRISTNFMNKAKDNDEDVAKFELSGVIAGINEEMDKDGNETGRIKVSFVIVGWMGRADVVELVAQDSKAAFIRDHWSVGDTVNLTGDIIMSHKVVEWTEEQGFGDPIKRQRTESVREYLIAGGSPAGLDEAFSYDSGDIKKALADRKERQAEIENKSSAPKSVAKSDFGF